MDKLINFFSNKISISKQTIDLIKEIFKYDELKKGDFFIQEGQYANEIAFLEDGIVRAFYVNNKGKEYNKHFFTSSSIIGSYASLINKQRNKVAQQALTDCKIWKAPFHKIEKLSQGNYEIERLRRSIAENYFLDSEKKELEMAMLNADQRYQIFQKEYPGFELKIPQYHIASYLGISPTQLSRIRKNLIK